MAIPACRRLRRFTLPRPVRPDPERVARELERRPGLPDHSVRLLLERLGPLADRLRLGQATRPGGRTLSLTLSLSCRRLGLSDRANLLRLRRGGQLDLLRVGGGRQLGLASAAPGSPRARM
jgi:hypothetical protein